VFKEKKKNLVSVFLVDVVFQGFRTSFLKVFRCNLDQVCEGTLNGIRVSVNKRVWLIVVLTRINIFD
jgi:hypothetical protein